MKVTFEKLPQNKNEFEMLINNGLTMPENTCAYFICALDLLSKNFNEGIKVINILKGPNQLSASEISWFKDRISDKKYLSRAYFDGATPENNYTPTLPYTLNFISDPRPQDREEGYIILQIKTPAFDSPRSITLRQKDDNWYLWNISNIMLGVRIPAENDPWA